jgi:endonuclease/exonuclease/phosphatase family metal-dependent hydrolase
MTVLQRKKRRYFSGRARIETDSGNLAKEKLYRLKKILQRTFLAVNIIFAASLLIAYISVSINPEDFALPAFFGLAYPYLLLINIIIAVIWAVNLRYEAFISVVIIAAGFTHFSNYIKLRKPPGDKTNTFRVMSYNIRLFNYFEGNKEGNTEKQILALARAQQPDILCIQELFLNGDANDKDLEIKKALGGKYYSHIKLFGRGKNNFYGIATYSKFPIVGKGEIIHPGSSSLSIYTDLVIGNDTFRVFNNHLQSFRLKRMETSFMEELVASDDKQTISEIRTVSKSLTQGFKRRALQAQVVKSYINRSPYPVIVAGDFNDTPVSYAYRKIRKGLNDAFVSSGYGAGFTYHGNYPPNRIDYILFGNTLLCTSFSILRVKYSDHYPIIAWFRRPG